jgi:hypothetical protein
MRLCDSVSAIGAALVDAEGETVDYAGAVDPFDIKVTAAEWVVLLFLLRQSKVPGWSTTETVIVRATRKSYFVHAIGEGYAVVLRLMPHAFGVSSRGLNEAVRELCLEAGLPLPAELQRESDAWHRVDVRCEPKRSRRPSAIWLGGAWTPVEVLGRWTSGLGRREVGYRTRLASGAEMTLVRERLGRWYAEGPLTL